MLARENSQSRCSMRLLSSSLIPPLAIELLRSLFNVLYSEIIRFLKSFRIFSSGLNSGQYYYSSQKCERLLRQQFLVHYFAM